MEDPQHNMLFMVFCLICVSCFGRGSKLFSSCTRSCLGQSITTIIKRNDNKLLIRAGKIRCVLMEQILLQALITVVDLECVILCFTPSISLTVLESSSTTTSSRRYLNDVPSPPPTKTQSPFSIPNSTSTH